MSSLRSRQPTSNDGGDSTNVHRSGVNDDEANKGKSLVGRDKQTFLMLGFLLLLISAGLLFGEGLFATTASSVDDVLDARPNINVVHSRNDEELAPMGKIVYGSKSKGSSTADLVRSAIRAGFRHVATGGFHSEYDEPAVGIAWKESGVPRNELYLQTSFVARSVEGYDARNCRMEEGCPPSPDGSIPDQVRSSVRSSLRNLQTDYIDAVLVHNFRAKLQPYEETLMAWKALEEYVDRGVVRHLGIVSVHDKDYLARLYDDVRIKPRIVQNRFHSNRGYDVELRPFLRERGVANQLFWILTGSAGGKIRSDKDVVRRMANQKGVSPQVLLYSFTMAIGGTPLIGTTSLDHMKEDVDGLLTNGTAVTWKDEELEAFARAIDKRLIRNIMRNDQ